MDTITSAWIREIRGEKWRIHGSTKDGGSAGLEAAGRWDTPEDTIVSQPLH
mgnify:CR=1 FL=1